MVNHGWSKLTLKPGDQVTVTVEPARNGRPVGRVMEGRHSQTAKKLKVVDSSGKVDRTQALREDPKSRSDSPKK